MFSVPLSFSAASQPNSHGRQAEPKISRPVQPPATACVAAPSGQRRWTVVVPRRLTARAAQALADAEARQSALPAAPDPIRFRPQLTMLGVIAMVASGLYVYSEKHAAASLDRQIAHAFEATVAAHQQSNLLRAEWALLNNPDRLHPFADRYLSLQPLSAGQFVKFADLHSRLPKILYGPPMPATDDDAGAPPIVTKHLLAMAEAPAPAEPAPDAPAPVMQAQLVQAQVGQAQVVQAGAPADQPGDMPDQPARTPVIAAPAHAFRVLAHAGAVPAIVDADPPASTPVDTRGETRLAEDEPARPVTEARSVHAALPPSWHAAPRPAAVASLLLPTQTPAARLAARVEPSRPRPLPHLPTLLRPELVHMLMMPHPLYTSTWTPRPAQPAAAKPVLPQHHIEYGRSDPPHFLSVPQAAPVKPAEPAQYAEARPRDLEQPRQDEVAPPVTYRSPPPYAYRPYWGGYNASPYGGYYYPAPRPVYPGYQ